MLETIKRYAISVLVTFVAGIAIVLAPALNDETLTLEAVKSGALVGVFFVAVRTAVKMVLELFLEWYATWVVKK